MNKHIYLFLILFFMSAMSTTMEKNQAGSNRSANSSSLNAEALIDAKLREAESTGNIQAMVDMAVQYYNQENPNEKKELEWLMKAVKLGNAEAISRIGEKYLLTNPSDYKKAREWLTKAAELGDANAILNLGVIYLNGLGVTKT